MTSRWQTRIDKTNAIPGSKLVIYAGTGHFTHEEVAARSATDARVFLLASIEP